MGIEERVPEFVEEALRARQVAAGLTKVLKMLPQTTMEQLAIRFNRCSLRDESEHVANLASDLGEGMFAIGYGILTVENEAQALARASPDGRDHGGAAVRACLAMIELKRRLAGNGE